MANYRVSTDTNNSNKTTQDKTNEQIKRQRKVDQLRLFKLKYDLLKISIDLQSAFSADTHLTEGHWLKEELNLVRLCTEWEHEDRQFTGQRGNI
jgi:hypothetical protein